MRDRENRVRGCMGASTLIKGEKTIKETLFLERVRRLNKPLEGKKGPIISHIKFELNFNAETLLDLFYK